MSLILEEQRALAIECGASVVDYAAIDVTSFSMTHEKLAAYTAAVEAGRDEEVAELTRKLTALEAGRERVLNSNTKIAARCEELEAKVERLKKQSADRLIGLCKCGIERDELTRKLAEQQARIDELVNQLGYEAQQMAPKYSTQALTALLAKERGRCANRCVVMRNHYINTNTYSTHEEAMLCAAASDCESAIRSLK